MKYNKKLLEKLIPSGWEFCERDVEIPFVLENLPEPPANVLDVACAYSNVLLELNKLGFDAWGIDLLDYGVETTKFIKADARKIPFPSATFDVVTCISALEHFGIVETPYHVDTTEDQEAGKKALLEMKRVTKQDGIIIVTLPLGFTNGSLKTWVKFFNKNLINELIENTGLEITKQKVMIHVDNSWKESTIEEAEKMETIDNVVANVCLVLKKK